MQAMKSLVAIPTANRPELLALTLEKLSETKDVPEVHIYCDSVPESRLREIEVVRDLYLPEAFLFHARPHVPAASGCWNILNAIKSASQYADTVYLVEEDVLVYPYFFDWHQTQESDISCGRSLPRFPLYTNPGSRFSRRALDVLIPHINDKYFQDTAAYCANFPDVHCSTLDDGLIRRVVAAEELTVSFPPTPVCAHVGFRNLGKLDIYQIGNGSLEERIERVRQLVAYPPNQKRYAGDWEPFQV